MRGGGRGEHSRSLIFIQSYASESPNRPSSIMRRDAGLGEPPSAADAAILLEQRLSEAEGVWRRKASRRCGLGSRASRRS